MNTTDTDNCGVICYIPHATFHDPTRGLSRDERLDHLIDKYSNFDLGGPSVVASTADWQRVTRAIRRGGLWVIESKAPEATVLLRFDPKDLTDSDYRIQSQVGRSGTGRVDKVLTIDSNESDGRFSMLSNFSTRFCVVTVATSRPFDKLVWRIGLNCFRECDPSDD